MDEASARYLASDEGARALAAARGVRGLPAHRRSRALAGVGSPLEVRAALAQDDLRARAAARCPHAEALLFTAGALEQASTWAVAVERAGRWPPPRDLPLADLGAGIGLDALAVALTGRPVVAFEGDPVRALLLEHNARALGVEDRVTVRGGDLCDWMPSGPLGFLDPDRRPEGRRTRDPEAFQPPRSRWQEILLRFERAIVKAPPTFEEAEPGAWAGQEVVSLQGRVRERRLYAGAWGALPPRRALALPSGLSVEGRGCAWPEPIAVTRGAWLLDPDAAVTVAGLVGDLAMRDLLRPVHPRIAYLVGPEPVARAPGHWMRVDARLAAKPKAVQRWLRAHDIGELTIRKRGIDDTVSAWRQRLRPHGPNAGTLVLTRDQDDRWVAYGCLA